MAMVSNLSNNGGMLSSGNVTGLNPSVARHNITNFLERSTNACRELVSVYSELYNELYSSWASPNAVRFNSYKSQIQKMLQSFAKETIEIARSAISQYNSIARANGAASFSLNLDSFGLAINTDVGKNLVDRQNDIVGMDIMSVDNIMGNFKNRISNVLDIINSIPTSIALFDRNASMQTQHYTNVSRAKNNVSSISNEILKSLEVAIEEERAKLQSASNVNN